MEQNKTNIDIAENALKVYDKTSKKEGKAIFKQGEANCIVYEDGTHDWRGDDEILKMEDGSIECEIAEELLEDFNLNVFSYKTQHFDFSEHAKEMFESAILKVEESGNESKREALSNAAKHLDSILLKAKECEELGNSIIEDEHIKRLMADVQMFAYNNYKSGLEISIDLVSNICSDILEFNEKEVKEVFECGGEMYAKGGVIDPLEKEFHKLLRDLNSKRLLAYIEGDESEEEEARKRERESKLKRFNEVLALLKEKTNKYEQGGEICELSQEENERLDELQKKEDNNELTKSENEEYETLVEKYRKTKNSKEYALGGLFNKEHYNTGRSWHQDRARHNKSEEWEKPLSERKENGGKVYAKGGTIETDTPILVGMIAENVARYKYFEKNAVPKKGENDLIKKADTTIAKLEKHLEEKANTIYKSNEHFKKQINQKGDKGRDSLYMYMEHWSDAFLDKKESGGELFNENEVVLGFGMLGNGTTVWDKNREVYNDYKKVAHISERGEINYYDKNLPQYAIDEIEKMAKKEVGGEVYAKGGGIQTKELGGFLLGVAAGVVGTKMFSKKENKDKIIDEKGEYNDELKLDDIKNAVDKEGLNEAIVDYSDWKDIDDVKFHELRKDYVNSYNSLSNYIDKKYKDDDIQYAINKEGFDYALTGYNHWGELQEKDTKFKLYRNNYLRQRSKLVDYLDLGENYKFEKGGKVTFADKVKAIEDKRKMAKGGVIYHKSGNLKSLRDANGKIVKEITVKGIKYVYKPTYKTYNSVDENKPLHKTDY